jgi:hypothetical protein
MKDKKTTILLLVAVGLVWGFAMYQLISAFLGKDDYSRPKTMLADTSVVNFVEDSFSLDLKYRDPFLGKIYRAEKPSGNRVINKTPAKVINKPEPEIKKHVDLSFIKYIGLIKNQNNGKQVSILSINGKDYFMLEGQIEMEITLKRNMIDSVEIVYLGTQYFIKK